MKIDVTNCKDCVFFIGSDLSNVGHCSMWNKSTSQVSPFLKVNLHL